MQRTRATYTAIALACVLALAGCAPEPAGNDDQTGSTAAPGPSETPVATDGAEPPVDDAPPADPTCETLISAGMTEAFTSQGWTARQDPFFAGDTQLEGGLKCAWGNFDAPSNDNVQSFGWAPINAEQASAAQETLIKQGWVTEVTDTVTYVTENKKTARVTDEDGYGMTYAFYPEYVLFADTKQSLLLIVVPQQ